MSRLHNVNLYTERGTSETITDVANRRAGYPLVGSNASVESFITLDLGNTRTDQSARAELSEQNDAFHIDNCLNNQILDAILDMPVGFRTKTTLRELQGCPIGLLSYKLRRRAVERFGSDSMIGSLVLVGTFVRFKNRVDTLEPRPSNISYEIPYYPKAISKDVDYFYFTQLSLDRVEYVWPFANSAPGDAIQGTTFRGRPNISLTQYMADFTHSSEGSDMTFFIMGYGSYIFKRFRNLRVTGYGGENARFLTQVVRSAGLRQVLYKGYEGIVGDEVNLDSLVMYIPSGSDGNCFEASLRWAYLKQTDDSQFNQFRLMWRRMMEEGGEKCKITANEYEERYKTNGYPTVQLRLLAISFFWLSGYKVELWYRKHHGKNKGLWVNLLHITSYTNEIRPVERECYGRIVLFQCEDTGLIRDDVRRFEENQMSEVESTCYKNSIEEGELGRMMHCIGVHPPPNYFGGKHLSRRDTEDFRKIMVKLVNEQSEKHFSEMYRHKKY